jgi:hypothetical protein
VASEGAAAPEGGCSPEPPPGERREREALGFRNLTSLFLHVHFS